MHSAADRNSVSSFFMRVLRKKSQQFAAVLAVVVGCASTRAGDTTSPLNFTRDVRPILANNCFQCHGPDKASRKTDLRLDVREDAGKIHGAETVLDTKNVADSEIIRRITSTDSDEHMPPTDSGKALKPE